MKHATLPVILALAASFAWCDVALAGDEPASFLDSLKQGKPTLGLRYRLENVSDDAAGSREATASTLRTTLGYRTRAYKNFSLFAEAENVAVIGDDSYNNRGAGSLGNGVNRPVVADPALTEFNQAYLQWNNGKTSWTAGRQEILHGDQRFVGAVGWRQNHQSFDAFSLTSTAVENWTLSYSFLDAVNRIFGDSQDLAGHLLNAKVSLGQAGGLTLYGYLLDYDTAAALSSSTFGAEFSGARELENGWKLLYEIEAAQQADAGDNPSNLDVGYRYLAVGGARGAVSFRVGLEVLEGSPQGSFRTPLATLHKFNGWADKFLATPLGGLEDLYLEIKGKSAKGIAWTAIYHDFSASESSASYGEELDLQATYKTGKGILLGLKAALYDAQDFAADTDKLMFWAASSF